MGKKYDGSLVFDTHIDTKEFENGIGKLKSIAKTGAVAIGAAFTTGLGALIVSGAKFNATIESYTTSFEVMTGSAKKATETVDKLRKMAAETPFELTGLANATQLLMNYGFEADTAIERMTMLGDISQGNQEKLTRIATAYGQMSSSGKVLLEDMKQMIEAGFNPLQEISQTTGESMASLYERISKGNIAVEEITNSMKRSTSEGGRYFQSMEKQSKTASGQLSTLKDNWSTFLGALAESSSESLKGSILPQLNEALETATNLVDDGALDGIDRLVEAAGDFVVDTIPALVNGLSTILDHTNLIKDAAIGIGAALITYKIATVISAINEKFLAAAPIISAYTAALEANQTTAWAGATANVMLASTMDKTTLAVGVLTGEVSVATAKTVLFNKAITLLKSPAGMAGLATVVVGAVAALVTYARNTDTAANRLRNLMKEHKDAIKSIDKTAKSEMAEAETVLQLKDRLYDLEDQIKSGTLSEAEAQKAQEDFNYTANKLNEIIPGIINNIGNETNGYIIQRDKVNELTQAFYELAYAKSMANAYQEKMNKTAAALSDVRDELKPYESGKKKKTHIMGQSYMGKGYSYEAQDATYAKLKKAEKKLTDEYKGYFSEMQSFGKQYEEWLAKTKKETKKTGDDLGNTAGSTGNKIKNTAQKTADDLDKIAREEERKAEKARERELQELKDQLELSEITEAEYYEKLANYRDKYFEEGSDEWYNYSIEIAKYQKRIADNAVEEQKKMVEKIIELRDELADKLRTDNDSLLESTQTTIHGSIFGEDGSGSYTSYSLADLEKENSRLEHYRDVILKLKDLGNVPAGIFTKLRDMSVEDGTRLAETILNADEEARSKFLNDYRSRDDLSDDIATQLSPILDAEKFEEEGIVAAQSFTDGYSKKLEEDKAAFIKILENRFGTLPDFYYNLGTDSADEFDKGFFEKVPEIVERFKQLFISEINSIAATISSGTAGKIRVSAAGGGNTYHTNTFTFNAAKQTVTEQLNEAKRAATLAKMRGN